MTDLPTFTNGGLLALIAVVQLALTVMIAAAAEPPQAEEPEALGAARGLDRDARAALARDARGES